MDSKDRVFLQQAIDLANQAEKDGNLPVGSLITLNDLVMAEGPSRVYQPYVDLTRHAEMEALRDLPSEFWRKTEDMVLYTTLSPCLMCLGAILISGINRVVYGSEYRQGGTTTLADHLPPFFKERYHRIEWIGPLMPLECDPLQIRLFEIENKKSM